MGAFQISIFWIIWTINWSHSADSFSESLNTPYFLRIIFWWSLGHQLEFDTTRMCECWSYWQIDELKIREIGINFIKLVITIIKKCKHGRKLQYPAFNFQQCFDGSKIWFLQFLAVSGCKKMWILKFVSIICAEWHFQIYFAFCVHATGYDTTTT